MIRILILKENETPADRDAILAAEKARLEKLISDHDATWLQRAATRTVEFKQKGEYFKSTPGWSEIKKVYRELQANKCAYCEQKLEDAEIVHDVEHFRPKSSIRRWLSEAHSRSLSFDFDDESQDQGYHLLALNLFNYVTSCKQCNSVLKSNCFPVAGQRLFGSDDLAALNAAEKPFLPYPLGHLDEDGPEDLIAFIGTSPTVNPSLTDPHKIRRAKLTIRFFKLASTRESLVKQRCRVIKKIYETVRAITLETDPAMLKILKADLVNLRAGNEEHTNCARSFYNLCMSDIAAARKHFMAASRYVLTHPNQ